MSIIISENGKNAKRVDESNFAHEDNLQEYIAENPDVIPLYDIDEDIHLLVLAREVPTGSGAIDVVGVDQTGTIYLIETKLFKNPDKRTVVAQVLDYGASIWGASDDFSEFQKLLAEYCQNLSEQTMEEKITSFFEMDGEQFNELLDNMRINFEAGDFKFVVLMDKLEQQLKDLILYLNQNSEFDIYAVELEYYKKDKLEITIPKLYGAEIKEASRSSAAASKRRAWTEDAFWNEVNANLDDDIAQKLREIYEWAKSTADEITWGSGTARGSFNPKFHKISMRSFMSVFTDGRVQINYGYLDPSEDRIKLRNILSKHVTIPDVTNVKDDRLQHEHPSIPPDTLDRNYDSIMKAVKEFIDQY